MSARQTKAVNSECESKCNDSQDNKIIGIFYIQDWSAIDSMLRCYSFSGAVRYYNCKSRVMSWLWKCRATNARLFKIVLFLIPVYIIQLS